MSLHKEDKFLFDCEVAAACEGDKAPACHFYAGVAINDIILLPWIITFFCLS
jgi:hypothetical protein